ncbi:MAG TPA: amidohydrolase family protein [Vicinamibacterales bacterium]|jgi:imidazolonepropionase-like amidohydrolase|nr:amidohydrolase family protein [Vicinamibacterales bacterium]
MRRLTLPIVGGLLLAAAALAPASAQRGAAPPPVLYEGARLITGDGAAPIESSAFLVENGGFTRVGRRGEVPAPAGATRVDLTGKTVIPALVDGHSHIGYMKNITSGAMNYTRENILDHMYRFAYFGVAASQAMGSDFGELPFQIRDEIMSGTHPDAARFLTAGRGLSPLDEISPDNMRQAAFPITTAAGARASVQELVPRKVKLVKTWVDDRGGAIKPLTPDLYTAIFDEAHKNGLRVAVHATDLKVAKDLLRAGIDVFAHMISDVDDELVALFKEHPNVGVLSALGGPRRAVYAPWLDPVHPLILETVRPEQIERLQGRFPIRNPEQLARAQETWDRLARGIRRLSEAGVKIGVGTDGGGQQGDQFIGWTMHAELENMVMAGIPPAKVLVAATRTSAEILGQDDLGMVAPGKSADFVVLDANPLDDIRNTRRISEVYLRGRRVDRERLRQMWATGGSAN